MIKDKPSDFVSIVMPAFNEERYIEAALKAVLDLDYPRELMEIIVVDNGSTDATVKIAEQYADKVFVVTGVRVGAVRNFGVKQAKGQIIAFMDSDCVPKKEWLIQSLEYMRTNACDAVGGIYLLRENPSWVESSWLINPQPADKPTEALVGGAIVISRDAFTKAGMFDETINAGEDYALARALIANGFKVHQAKCCALVHLGYPNSVEAFVKRQIWHSSSYIKTRKKGALDAVFIITASFLAASILTCILMLAGVLLPAFVLLAFTALLPLILSLKRVVQAKFYTVRLDKYIKIYLIDALYLIGRSAGLFISILVELGIIKDKKLHY